MAKVIWMSDLHFLAEGDVAGHDPRQRLDAAIDYINRHHNDAEKCVISGDLADDGSAATYAVLRERLDRLDVPYLPMVGNHDNRAHLAKELPLPNARQDNFVQYSVDLPGAVLLCLDTLVPGDGAGELCASRLEWLTGQLRARPGVPTYVFMHHPPAPLGLPAQDVVRLKNDAAFLNLLASFSDVRQIFAGHVHRRCSASISGLGVTTMKSVAFQAPAPWPAWNWDSFQPAHEAPAIGVIGIDGRDFRLQTVEFCTAEFGRDQGNIPDINQ